MIVNILLLFLFFVLGSVFRDYMHSKKVEDVVPKKSVPPPSFTPEPPLDTHKDFAVSELTEKLWLEEEMSFIFRLNEKISLTHNKELISRYIAEEVYRFFNAGCCALFLWNESIHKLDLEFMEGNDKKKFEGFALLKGESITGLVMKNKQPLFINNLQTYSYYTELNKEPFLSNSIMSVPLVVKDEVLGVISISSKANSGPFKNKDLEFLVNVARVGAISFENTRLLEHIQEGYLKTIMTLALIIDARDHYTKRHSENVMRYSLAVAREMKFPSSQIELFRRAALLHDIGKIGIRDDVLLKEDKLSEFEFEQIKTHPVKGEEIVKSLPFLEEVSVLIRQHHERYDGKGYPDGLAGKDIEIGSRILSVADAFDAMTTDRPYRKKLALETAQEELRKNKNSQFDPAVVDCFLSVLEKSPDIIKEE